MTKSELIKVHHRDKTLDIAKGLCIIFMVVGHSGCPTYLRDFIYMFHMPCFFFISGWLLSDEYLHDLKRGLYRKIKGTYIPYVKWMLIFLLFHNVFASIHIYENSYSWQTFMMGILRAFTMTGREPLLGGFWFLVSLFWASVISLLFLYMLFNYMALTWKNISVGVIIILVVAMLRHYIPFRLPGMFGEQTLLAIAFYTSGFLCRKKKILSGLQLKERLLLLVVPAVAAFFFKLEMISVQGWFVLVYYVIAIPGIISILLLSRELSRHHIAFILTYIGDKTLYILVFHFFAFKLISYLYIYINGLPISLLTSHPVLTETNSWLWIAYVICGVALPLAIWELTRKVKSYVPFAKNELV